jgi:hypothetical protein
MVDRNRSLITTEESLNAAKWFTRRNRNRQKHLWRRVLDLSFADRQNAREREMFGWSPCHRALSPLRLGDTTIFIAMSCSQSSVLFWLIGHDEIAIQR